MAAVAAAVVVLPTPPDPQVTTISLEAKSCSRVPAARAGEPCRAALRAGLRARGTGATSYPISAASASAMARVERTPWSG